MSVLEVLALLGYGLACVKFGYIMGINAKKYPPELGKLRLLFCDSINQGQPSIGSTLCIYSLPQKCFSCKVCGE